MRVGEANPQDVAAVAAAMRQRDRDEFMPLGHDKTHVELVTNLTMRFGRHPDVFVVYDDPGPVAVGGMLLHRPNVATLLFFATDDFKGRVAADFTRFVKQRLFPRYEARGVHRIECISLDGYDEIHRWLDTLGLTEEADLKKFGRDGQGYVQFSKVEND